MFNVVILILLFTYVQCGNAIHCFNCKVDNKMVDITRLNIEQIQSLFESSQCTTGGYAIGTDQMITCKDETAEPSSALVFNGSAEAINVSKSVLYNVSSDLPKITTRNFFLGESQNSSNGECVWIRNHVDCSQADDEDRSPLCDCRRPKYQHGCSGGRGWKMASWVLLLNCVCAFVLGKQYSDRI